MRRIGIVTVVAVAIGVWGYGIGWAEELSTAALMKEARHQEEILGDVSTAAARYAELLARGNTATEQKTQAHLHLGVCLVKLGRADEAKDHFEWVMANARAGDPASRQAASEAQSKLKMLTAADPATVMPPDTTLYVEVIRPGEQLEQLLQIFADAGMPDPLSMLLEQAKATRTGPGGRGVQAAALGPMMLLNPSLINEMKKIEGLAVGVVQFDDPATPGEDPSLVGVLYPGQSDAVRGMLEIIIGAGSAGVETHGNATVYLLKTGPKAIYAATTADAILIGTPKKMVTDVIDRMSGTSPSSGTRETAIPRDSLASQERFQRQAGARRMDSAVLAYLDLDRLIGQIPNGGPGQGMNNEFAMVDKMFDIRAIEQVSARSRITNDGVLIEFAASLKPGHTSAVYDIIRTPPADRSLLKFVPADALGFATLAVGDGEERYERIRVFTEKLLEFLQRDNPAAQRQTASQAVALVEQMIGISIRDDLMVNVESALIAMLPPEMPDIEARTTSPDTSRPTSPHGVQAAAMLNMGWSNIGGFMVVKAKNAERFDQSLEALMNVAARRFTRQADAEGVIRRKNVGDVEMRTYVMPGVPVMPVVAKAGRVYLICVSEDSEDVVKQLLAAHDGTAENVLTGGPSAEVLATVPVSASKIGAVRIDQVLNTLRSLGLAIRAASEANGDTGGSLPGAMALAMSLPEMPALKPIAFYSIENESEMSLRCEITDLPRLIGAGIEAAQGAAVARAHSQFEAVEYFQGLHKAAVALQAHAAQNQDRLPSSLDELAGDWHGNDPKLGPQLSEFVYLLPGVDQRQMKQPWMTMMLHRSYDAWPAGGMPVAFADGRGLLIRSEQRFNELVAEAKLVQLISGPTLHGQLELFRLEVGRYPGGLQELIEKPKKQQDAEKWKGPYLRGRDTLTDPWGNGLRYRHPGKHNPAKYDLWSTGRDGKDGTADDVRNWPSR